MKDYIEIDTTPVDEPCVQVPGDVNLMRLEGRAMIQQLERQFGEFPDKFMIKINKNYHDFGTYLDLQLFYECDHPSEDFAFEIEGNIPEKWDNEAIKFLEENGYTTLNVTADNRYASGNQFTGTFN